VIRINSAPLQAKEGNSSLISYPRRRRRTTLHDDVTKPIARPVFFRSVNGQRMLNVQIARNLTSSTHANNSPINLDFSA